MNNMIINPVIPLFIIIPVIIILFAALIAVMIRKKSRIAMIVFAGIRYFIIFGLIFMINLRIMTGHKESMANFNNIDVLFVADTTLSMWAKDYDGSNERMDGVIDTCRYIMKKLDGGNFALIRFDNNSQILCPFTQDSVNVDDALTTIIKPEEGYAYGTSLNEPYDNIEELLISSAKKKDRQTVIFFISDGEITDGSRLRGYLSLSQYIDGGAVLGFGTVSGGKMQGGNGRAIVDSKTGQTAISHIEEDTLKKIANDMGVKYIHVEKPEDTEGVLATIKSMAEELREKTDAVTYEDTYFYWTVPLIIMLFAEFLIFARKGRF